MLRCLPLPLLLLPLACGDPPRTGDAEAGTTSSTSPGPGSDTTDPPATSTAPATSTSPATSTASPAESSSSGEPPSLGELLFAAGFEAQVAPWELIREDPTGWRLDADRFELRSFPGTLWEASNNTTNVAVRPLPAEAFTLQVTVEGPIDAPAEQGGLLWYVDDDNYIKLVKEQVGGVIVVVMVTELAGTPEVNNFGPLAQDRTDLRLTVTPDTLTGAYRPNPEADWTEIATTARPPGPTPRIGLFTQGAPQDTERWATFSAFSY